jgi:hypothetical protein
VDEKPPKSIEQCGGENTSYTLAGPFLKTALAAATSKLFFVTVITGVAFA